MSQHIVERVQEILLRPEDAWGSIRLETTSNEAIIKSYITPLAAVPAISGFFGSLFAGANFFRALLWGALYFGLLIAAVVLTAKVLQYLAESLRITLDDAKLFRIVAYSSTPFILSGFFYLIPPLYWLSILGLYNYYIFFIGLNQLLKLPEQEKLTYQILAVIVLAFFQLLSYTLAGAISGIEVSYLRM